MDLGHFIEDINRRKIGRQASSEEIAVLDYMFKGGLYPISDDSDYLELGEICRISNPLPDLVRLSYKLPPDTTASFSSGRANLYFERLASGLKTVEVKSFTLGTSSASSLP